MSLLLALMNLYATKAELNLEELNSHPHQACLFLIIKDLDRRIFEGNATEAQDNLNILQNHPCPGYILHEFQRRPKKEADSSDNAQANFNAVMNIDYSKSMIQAHDIIMKISSEETWSKNCHDVLVAHNPSLLASIIQALTSIIQALNSAGLLNEDDAEQKLKPIFSMYNKDTARAWETIPLCEFTPELVNDILKIINSQKKSPYEKEQDFIRYVNQKMRASPPPSNPSAIKRKNSDTWGDERFFKKTTIESDIILPSAISEFNPNRLDSVMEAKNTLQP